MARLKHNEGIALNNPSLRIKDSRDGITLIALVITIIVLLILAGVSIALLTGENGIIIKAITATEETKKQGALEKVKISIAGSLDNQGKYNVDLAKNNIEKDIEGANVIKYADNSLTVETEGYLIEVSPVGKVLYPIDENESESLPFTDDTKPYFPNDNFVKEKGTNLKTGLVIKDSDGNSYVWVEVPKNIYSTAKSNIDYENIEKDMQNYSLDYRSDFTDTWYYGCGLEENDYNELKNKMLTSLYDNGGFWISQYEIGTQTQRTSKTDELTKPVSKEGTYIYNYVTVSQAQQLSNEINSGNYNSSLLFGIQWDLLMKYLESKGGKSQTELKADSSGWGNYSNATFDIKKGKYSEDDGNTFVNVTETYAKTEKGVILTTGASERNSLLNIYDLAGNVFEWTLEKGTDPDYFVTNRGGDYRNNGNKFPVNCRNTSGKTYSHFPVGFRTALY